MRAEGLKASPLGVLIHPEFGLWHAYRAAFLFDAPIDYAKARSLPFPCATCREKPCLSTCPVGAITERGYDVAACASHVASTAGSTCREGGCLARRACPVGSTFTYPAKAMEFHMAAFLKGRAPA
jgi:Fe-S-cluster-containing hydrogenase component 2